MEKSLKNGDKREALHFPVFIINLFCLDFCGNEENEAGRHITKSMEAVEMDPIQLLLAAIVELSAVTIDTLPEYFYTCGKTADMCYDGTTQHPLWSAVGYTRSNDTATVYLRRPVLFEKIRKYWPNLHYIGRLNPDFAPITYISKQDFGTLSVSVAPADTGVVTYGQYYDILEKYLETGRTPKNVVMIVTKIGFLYDREFDGKEFKKRR